MHPPRDLTFLYQIPPTLTELIENHSQRHLLLNPYCFRAIAYTADLLNSNSSFNPFHKTPEEQVPSGDLVQ